MRKILIVLCCLTGVLSKSQEFSNDYFRSPLDIPLYLSGNFGELRTNHYHSGIDIKTQGVVGKRVYATADGWVSRVKVSPYGYGNAIYIEHPNGYTTVYGHLHKFSNRIDSVVKSFQYAQESFDIDEYLESNVLAVKKGEIIALSGNSGSSGGPHLHYEIRETKTEYPINPFYANLPIQDHKPPVLRELFIYPIDEKAKINEMNSIKRFRLSLKGRSYSIKDDVIPSVSGRIGFGIDTRDYMDGTHNYYGIYSLKMYVDEKLQHSFTFNKFSFFESRYINAHIDYALFKKEKRRIHKLFHEPNQKESFAEKINRGIMFDSEQKHKVRIDISDWFGNHRSLRFEVRGKPVENIPLLDRDMWSYDKDNVVETENFKAVIPAMALYKNIEKEKVGVSKSRLINSCSPTYTLLDNSVPIHTNIKIAIKPHNYSKELRSKIFLARENKANEYSFLGNVWEKDYIVGKSNEFGRFVLLTDEIAPKIELSKGGNYKTTGKLSYIISDDLSGIATYRGMIDDKWVLFEYDAKQKKIWHKLSDKVIARGGKHQLILTVTDNVGNKSVRKASFTW